MRLTKLQREALRRANEFGKVVQAHDDGFDHHRPNVAARITLESLRARGLLEPYDGPRYMPVYLLTEAGRKEL